MRFNDTELGRDAVDKIKASAQSILIAANARVARKMGLAHFCMFYIYHHPHHSNPWRQLLLSFPPVGRKLKPGEFKELSKVTG